MARIPENELERLKSEISVERLVEASGIALKKSGKDLLGQCPFHDDGEPSLVVTPRQEPVALLRLRAGRQPHRLGDESPGYFVPPCRGTAARRFGDGE